MTTQSDLSTSIKVLKETIAWFKKQIEPHDCGWMYTTIDGLNHRIKILKNDMERDKFMTSPEAVKYGLADKIVTSREEDNKEE